MTVERRSTRDSMTRASHQSNAISGRRSRQSALHSKLHSKAEPGGSGPVVLDPDDGTNRTPKGLLHSGSLQIPIKQLAGLVSAQDDSLQLHAVAETVLDVLPSLGSISIGGSVVTQRGTESVEPAEQQNARASTDIPQGHAAPLSEREPGVGEQLDAPQLSDIDIDLAQITTVTITETNTLVLFEKPAYAVNQDSAAGKTVMEANASYEDVLNVKVGNDNYVPALTQTIENGATLRKQKYVQTGAVEHGDSGAQWHAEVEAAAKSEPSEGAAGTAAPDMLREATAKVSFIPAAAADAGVGASAAFRSKLGDSSMTDNASVRFSSSIRDPGSQGGIPAVHPLIVSNIEMDTDGSQMGLQSLHGLSEALNDMECMIMHNKFLNELLLYKGMRPMSDMLGDWILRTSSQSEAHHVDSDDGNCLNPGTAEAETTQRAASDATRPDVTNMESNAGCPTADALASIVGTGARMHRLWQWKCDLTQGRSVTSMSWNTDRHDLVAVGYGSFVFGNTMDGLVCIWSLRNPNYPLWWFTVEAGVTSLDFSNVTGGVLAIGLYSGNIAVYDVKAKNPEPSISSHGAPGKHHDPVWKVKWMDTGNIASTLVSISTDGRVTRWRLTKGLEHNDLMKLKRVQRRDTVYTSHRMANIARSLKQEAFISRLTAGTAFDFSMNDERIYLAATEDGWIHKCSTSYSEQQLASYKDHMGPVYSVQWCPFHPNLFISASADWTVRLWRADRPHALLTFQTGNHEINDVQWCPSNSTAFATATGAGNVDVWDMLHGTLKPVATFVDPSVRMTCVLFHTDSETMIAGDDDGGVSVFRLFGVTRKYDSDEAQQKRLMDAMDANVMKTGGGQASSMS